MPMRNGYVDSIHQIKGGNRNIKLNSIYRGGATILVLSLDKSRHLICTAANSPDIDSVASSRAHQQPVDPLITRFERVQT
jgi:hypothetical protein